MRQITRETLLYTEMMGDSAVTHNSSQLESFIGINHHIESPIAVQLGGCNPEVLSEAAYLCEGYGQFYEINLNAGCPSNKAKKAGFGAELMLDPESVRKIVYTMKRKLSRTEVSVKCRLGVTGRDSWSDLVEFIEAVRAGGVRRIIVHARSCVLRGLTPAQNRSIPPIRYEPVHRLAEMYPDMSIVLNGGITSFDQVDQHVSLTAYSMRNTD